MSKAKKNLKKTPQAKAAQAAVKKEKKKIDPKTVKTILVTLAAVAAVAAIVLLAIFVIKPAIEENKNKKPDPVTTTQKGYEQGDEFLPVEYNGLSIPGVFADLLKEAEAERESLCGKYGVAVEIGDIKISRPEFNMYYYDQYIGKYYDVQTSISDNGTNMTGFDPSMAPEDQKHIRGNGTWADYFTYEAINNMQKNYADFERACKAGTQLSAEDITGLVSAYDQVTKGAESDGLTVDEHMSDMYVEGVDFSMFFASVIMESYATQFRKDEKQRLTDSFTDADLQAKYDENPMQYKVAKVRVYMIEGEYNAAEAAAVCNEKEFLEYAKNNYPYDGYDADYNTDLGWIAYADLEVYHGETVANWAFDSNRVAGEIGVVEDFLARYIIYVEEPAFDSHTYQIVSYRNQYAALDNHKPSVDAATEFYNEWKNGKQTEESFRELAEQSGYMEEDAAIITRYDLEVAEWFADPARKKGDTAQFEASDAAYVIYFVKENPDDLNWKKDAGTALAEEKYEEQFKALIDKEYKTEMNQTPLTQCYKNVNARVKRYVEANSR